MKNQTVTITVAASVEEVYSFLSNPEKLPLWANSFCESVRKENDRWVIVTPQGGELSFAVDADRSSGCIEMLAGPTIEMMESFPIRVYRVDNGQTAASFTMFKSQRPDMTDEIFETQYRILVREVGSLVERFGGGEVSSGLSGGSRCYAGLVCDNLAEVRDFYVNHFEFSAVFDAPFYVHLKRESGEQIGLLSQKDQGEQPELTRATDGVGTWISIEVDDVDAEFRRLSEAGLAFREEPTDQPWGERTCVTTDPNGVLIYISQTTGKVDDSMKSFLVEDSAELVG